MLKHHVILDAVTQAERLAQFANGLSRELINPSGCIAKARRNDISNVADRGLEETKQVFFHS